jgi:myo-inositol-1-phosphate synthase
MSLADPSRHEIRVAIVGVGNCASSLVQGIAIYRMAAPTTRSASCTWDLGGYRPKDIQVVAALGCGPT